MKIDSHQHFWSLARGDYGWLTPELEQIYRDFTPGDLGPLLNSAGIDKTIVVQATDTVAETEFLLELADAHDFIAGVVGWIDMEAENAIGTLERLAQNPYFKGIRPMIQSIEDDEWILKPELDPVFDALQNMGLAFDALVLPHHLPHLLTRLARNPSLKCVIDHAAKPDLRGGNLEVWRRGMLRLANETNCFCKFSGLVTEAHTGCSPQDLKPATDLILSAFGANRLMFGSDWPVLNLAKDYQGWADMVATITGYSGDDAAAFWGRNASLFYDIRN
ncbi:L-fuconolactonase [Shimia gijangensis]|uniref:L-fuconolactonase n=1 Tax=Shimia gijangensis TaxID=1470563 RepID=A0A1M6GUS0_9RHOB|nr:amidohydrolase family protein [Shimia gijangensis]SHJ13664.1 L-fuconolactonase [Shimia gijangensis]